MLSLRDPIRYVSGVGPEMARRLAKLEIRTLRDLLFHVPRGYRDRRLITPIAFLRPHTEASVLGRVAAVPLERRLPGKRAGAGPIPDGNGGPRPGGFQHPLTPAPPL